MAGFEPEMGNNGSIGSRYGEIIGREWKRWGPKITANQAAPSDPLHGLAKHVRSPYVGWAVIKPAGIVDFSLSVYRLVEYQDAGGAVQAWVLDETKAGLTASTVYIQPSFGDVVAVRITASTGAFGDGFVICHKPIAAQ